MTDELDDLFAELRERGVPEGSLEWRRAEVAAFQHQERIKLAQRHRQEAYEEEVRRENDPLWQIAYALRRLAAAQEELVRTPSTPTRATSR
jgi:hypothetical protein